MAIKAKLYLPKEQTLASVESLPEQPYIHTSKTSKKSKKSKTPKKSKVPKKSKKSKNAKPLGRSADSFFNVPLVNSPFIRHDPQHTNISSMPLDNSDIRYDHFGVPHMQKLPNNDYITKPHGGARQSNTWGNQTHIMPIITSNGDYEEGNRYNVLYDSKDAFLAKKTQKYDTESIYWKLPVISQGIIDKRFLKF